MSMELHRQAEQYMAQAELLEAAGDIGGAQIYFRKAAEEEAFAFERVPAERRRTRGIIAVSAVSLYWRAHEFEAGIRLAHRYLSLDGLTDTTRGELDELLLEIQRARRAEAAGRSYSGRSLDVCLRGHDYSHGLAPLDTLMLKLQQVRSLLTRSAEWTAGWPFRQQGPIPEEVSALFSPFIGAPSSGSYRFQLRIESPAQPRLFYLEEPRLPTSNEIADSFFTVLRLAVSGEPQELNDRVPDALYRTTFRRLIRNLAPGGGDLREIEVADRSREDLAPVLLTRDSARAIGRTIPRPEQRPGQDEPIGTLRALDLDGSWLTLVEKGQDQRYAIRKGSVFDDVVGPFVNRRVRLIGRWHQRRFIVEDIESAENEPEQDGGQAPP